MQLTNTLEDYFASNTRLTSEATEKNYRIALRQFEDFLGRVAKIPDLTDDNMASYMRWQLCKGITVATCNHKRRCLVAFWRWCCKRNLMAQWPTICSIPEPEQIPTAWTLTDIGRLLVACKKRKGYLAGVRAANWWHSFHLFLYFHGERKSAALGASWSNYNGHSLIIPAQDRKGGRKAMLYELMPDVIAGIEQIRRPKRDLIWPWPPGKDFYYHYRQLVKSSGLNYEKWRSGPQKMRKSYASYLTAAGGDATKGLRHTNSSLTRNCYIDPRIAKPVNQSALLPRVG